MSADLHATVASRLQRVEQRYTAGRRQLVDTLAVAGRPLSIPEVMAAGVTVPQSSVYRNLAVLEQASCVRRVLAADEFARYELAEDLTEHHHHLVCVVCGAVEDFTVPPALERSLERAMATLVAETGFHPDAHRLDLVGHCRRCHAARGDVT